jgi:hypothetical protein
MSHDRTCTPRICLSSNAFQAGIPYLRAKARDYYESLGGGIDPDVLHGDDGGRVARALTDQASASSARSPAFLIPQGAELDGPLPSSIQGRVSLDEHGLRRLAAGI